MKVKTPTPSGDITGVVYAIYCECGEVCIGETGRSLKTRIAEHQTSIRNWDRNNAIACHVTETKHNIKCEETEVLARVSN